MNTARKDVPTYLPFRPLSATHLKADQVRGEMTCRLYQEVFRDVDVRNSFEPRLRDVIARGMHAPRMNVSWRLKEIMQAMKKAGMSESDVEAIITDLEAFKIELFADAVVTEREIVEAAHEELVMDTREDVAQQRFLAHRTPQNAMDYAVEAARSVGSTKAFLGLSRKFAQVMR